jgi:hypothetical protein
MAYLDIATFQNYSTYSAEILDQMGMTYYATEILEKFSAILDDEIGTLFSLENVLNYDYRGGNTYFVGIGAWQDDITISMGTYGQSTVPLVFGKDYMLEYYKGQKRPNQPTPVYAVTMLQLKVTDQQFLRISGTYGWSDGLPEDLYMAIYGAAKSAVDYNYNMSKNRGSGIQNLTKSLTLTESSYIPDRAIDVMRGLSEGNLYADPFIRDKIQKYKSYTKLKQAIIS